MSLRATPIENIPIFPGNSRPSSTEIDFVGDIRPQFGLKTVFPQAFGPTTEIDAYKMPRGGSLVNKYTMSSEFVRAKVRDSPDQKVQDLWKKLVKAVENTEGLYRYYKATGKL